MSDYVVDMVPKRKRGGHVVWMAKRKRGWLDVSYGLVTAAVAGFIGHFFFELPFWDMTVLVSDNATLMVAAYAIAYFLPK